MTTDNRARQGPWIPLLLAVSLACNIWLIFQVRAHQNDLMIQLNRIAHVEGTLRSEIDRLVYRVSTLEREVAWVVGMGISYSEEDYADGSLPVRLQWSFTELARDAEVSLVHHPAGRPDELQEATAANPGGGVWAVDLLLDPMVIWEYRIAVTAGGSQKATEARQLDMRKLVETTLVLEWSHDAPSSDWSLIVHQRQLAELTPYQIASVKVSSASPDGPAEFTIESLEERGWLASAPGVPRHLLVDVTFTLNNGASYDVRLSTDAQGDGAVEGVLAIPPR